MKKILAACLLLAVLPLFAGDFPKKIPTGPGRKAALEKIYGRVAIIQDQVYADYKITFVENDVDADIRVAFSNNPDSPGLWKPVSSSPDFTVCVVDWVYADFRVIVVGSGDHGVRCVE